MNRRELFKGLAAALTAAAIPVTIEQIVATPDSEMLRYLRRVQQDIFNLLINPPVVMNEDGTITQLDQPSLRDAMQHIDALIYTLERGETA